MREGGRQEEVEVGVRNGILEFRVVIRGREGAWLIPAGLHLIGTMTIQTGNNSGKGWEGQEEDSFWNLQGGGKLRYGITPIERPNGFSPPGLVFRNGGTHGSQE
jgi:hypothetical protein